MATDKILATAEELARQLAESEQYAALKKAEAELEEHAAAKIMWEDFLKKQQACYEPGIDEEEAKKRIEEVQKNIELIGHNPYIRQFLMAQMEFGQLWEQIQKTLAEAIGIVAPEGETEDEES